MVSKKTSSANFTVPGLTLKDGHQVAAILQSRLHALNDLQLTLKHAHWNVVGRDFIGVHEMLDPQIELVRAMIDETAERIATLGVSPSGLPGALVKERDWNDYAIGRASTTEHLAALDIVYDGIISSHRDAIAATGELDPITEDMLIGHSAKLELFQWFMRAHLENNTGSLIHGNSATEKGAAKSARN
ncbi:Dps family protein [Arthrobacter glacialis]|uniref:DNA starvation/stationary phase protection protein n=1 Tax=Arthrobacter glacialis TaxID=1664 RepID=A0A2S3ZTL8_ARTGL|nr:DNA starvation/stationary phase protection protein [Arthrobacter glacialis]POH57281.1 DNA starvation/stationary phase protection protein [Arthrobacter glacialis]POH72424.1 DNA starvation/stationary phase protection protein [Arthrobacter glacialis]